MNEYDAAALASSSSYTLTQCGVTVNTLQALKDAMYDHKGMDLDMTTLRASILVLAEQHVSPPKVRAFYETLTSSYTFSGGLSLPKTDAQSFTLTLVRKRAEPDQLKALYKVMYGYSGLGFKKPLAQRTAIELSLYGADAEQFKESYTSAKGKGSSEQAALQLATEDAVKANLQGVVRRYALDAKLYTAEEFEKYYSRQWLSEWEAGPQEKRLSSDRQAYTASQYSRHFPSASWAAKYRTASTATQERLANDGKAYTVDEFQEFYRDSWRTRWAAAPEVACAECSPYAAKEVQASLLV